jgi:hypothetical protein
MSLGARFRLYVWRNLIAWDQAINAVAGGNPDESISSRAQKAKERWLADKRRLHDLWGWLLLDFILNPLCRWLFRQEDHGLASVERDEGK